VYNNEDYARIRLVSQPLFNLLETVPAPFSRARVAVSGG
jgi:hypothetical protein